MSNGQYDDAQLKDVSDCYRPLLNAYFQQKRLETKIEELAKKEGAIGFCKVTLGYGPSGCITRFRLEDGIDEEEEEIIYSEIEKYWLSFENKLCPEAIKAYNTWTKNLIERAQTKYGESWEWEEVKKRAAKGDSIAQELLRKNSIWDEYYDDYNREVIDKNQQIEWDRQAREEARQESRRRDREQEKKLRREQERNNHSDGASGFVAGWVTCELINKHKANKEKEEVTRREREESWRNFEMQRIAQSKADHDKRTQDRLAIEHETRERLNREMEKDKAKRRSRNEI
jgi:hypothetical protein